MSGQSPSAGRNAGRNAPDAKEDAAAPKNKRLQRQSLMPDAI